jgi:hypothetical protein
LQSEAGQKYLAEQEHLKKEKEEEEARLKAEKEKKEEEARLKAEKEKEEEARLKAEKEKEIKEKWKKELFESLKTTEGQKWLGSGEGQDWLGSRDCWEWIETQDGQTWLDSKDGEFWLSSYNIGKEWLDSPQGKKWFAKKKKIEKAKKRWQIFVKMPVFIVVSIFSIFARIDPLMFAGADEWAPLLLFFGAIVLMLIIFYKMLTGAINFFYNILAVTIREEETKTNTKMTGLSRFITNLLACLIVASIISAIHFGIVHLVMHVLLKAW